jgi:hypothetical protein
MREKEVVRARLRTCVGRGVCGSGWAAELDRADEAEGDGLTCLLRREGVEEELGQRSSGTTYDDLEDEYCSRVVPGHSVRRCDYPQNRDEKHVALRQHGPPANSPPTFPCPSPDAFRPCAPSTASAGPTPPKRPSTRTASPGLLARALMQIPTPRPRQRPVHPHQHPARVHTHDSHTAPMSGPALPTTPPRAISTRAPLPTRSSAARARAHAAPPSSPSSTRCPTPRPAPFDQPFSAPPRPQAGTTCTRAGSAGAATRCTRGVRRRAGRTSGPAESARTTPHPHRHPAGSWRED